MTTTTTTTREDVLAYAARLRRAWLLLEVHARRCTDPDAPAHAEALRQAHGIVRRLPTGKDGEQHD